MTSELERRLIEPAPEDEVAQAARRCLVRLRGEGKTLAAIAAGLEAEAGISLPEDAVDRVLRQIAGPVPRQEGGDPAYFTGWLGGG
jgi:hypothetical protein